MLTMLVVLSLVTYRIARFLILDTLIDTPRIWIHQVIIGKPKAWRMNLYELITCPYCLTIWIAAAVVIIADGFYSVPAPIGMWLATATGSLIAWKIIED
jgi:hypothetical protein